VKLTKTQRNALRKVGRCEVHAQHKVLKNGNSNRTYYSLLKRGLIAWHFCGASLGLTDDGQATLDRIGPSHER
jgi:hypothetical protein